MGGAEYARLGKLTPAPKCLVSGACSGGYFEIDGHVTSVSLFKNGRRIETGPKTRRFRVAALRRSFGPMSNSNCSFQPDGSMIEREMSIDEIDGFRFPNRSRFNGRFRRCHRAG
jgi:hypothetical protein